MPSCPTHLDVSLEAVSRGWYCPACDRRVLPTDAPAPQDAPQPVMAYARLPSVVALPLAAFEQEAAPALALWAACDLVEMTLRLCVTAGVAQHGTLPRELREDLRRNVERPTLGKWLDMARSIASHERPDAPLPLKGLVATIADLLGASTAPPEDGLLALRNRLAHGGPLPRAEARELLRRWSPRVLEWAASALAPLEATELVAVDPHGARLLLSGNEARPVTVPLPLPDGAPPGSAWLCVRGHALQLGPLAAFDAGVHMYVRRGEVRLQYVRISDQGGLTESSAEAMAQFEKMFLADADARGRSRRVAGFEQELAREAARRIGRDAELATLPEVIRTARGGVVWVSGQAGMGKSNLMAAVACDLQAQPPEATLVLPYRFRATDARCSRTTFLRYVEERLDERWLVATATSASNDGADATTMVKRLLQRLGRLRPGVQVLWILDGLDEIAERDRTFVNEVLFQLRRPACTLVAAGRPSCGLDEMFRKIDAVQPFPGGLPPMHEGDVRRLILELATGRRRQVIEQDRETPHGGTNAFIDQVTRRSDGLPIYVNHVVGDLLSGRLRADRPETLPGKLRDYHEELLVQAATGHLQGITTHVMALLAVAHDSLTPAELSALLQRRALLSESDEALAERALLALAPLLRRGRRPDGTEGYALFHASLRAHVLESDRMHHAVTTARRTLAAFAEQPEGDAATGYLYRCGVRHLVEVARTERAIASLCDMRFIIARLTHPGDPDAAAGWVEDWRRVEVALGKLVGEAEAWSVFAQACAYALANAGPFAHRAFFQLAMEHADSSPLTLAAEAYEVSGQRTWSWLRPLNRPVRAPLPALVRHLEGHGRKVLGAVSLSDDTVLTWCEDGTLRTWDTALGACLATMFWHDGPVAGVCPTGDGRVVSWTKDGSVRVGAIAGEATACTLPMSSDTLRQVVPIGTTHLLVRTTRGRLRLWDLRAETFVAVTDSRVPSHARGLLDLGDGSVLCWGRQALCRWWPAGDRPTETWSEEVDYARAVRTAPDLVTLFRPGGRLETFRVSDGVCVYLAELGTDTSHGTVSIAEGRHVAWCDDRTLRVWAPEGGLQVTVPCATKAPSGVVAVGDRHFVSWEASRTLRVWESATGKEVGRWRAPGRVLGCLALADGTVLSWGTDGLLFVWDPARVDDLGEDGHHENAIQGVHVLRDGRVVTCAPDLTVRTWSEDGDLLGVYRGHTRSVAGVTELSDGRVLSWERGGASCALRAWSPDAVAPEVTFRRASEGPGHVGACVARRSCRADACSRGAPTARSAPGISTMDACSR